jgi:hypothetical protein
VTIRGIPVGRENQETTVQPQTTNQKSNHRSSALDGDPGRIKPRKSFSHKTYIYRIFAPEPLGLGGQKGPGVSLAARHRASGAYWVHRKKGTDVSRKMKSPKKRFIYQCEFCA